MARSRGKTFETEINKSLEYHYDVGWLYRPQDTSVTGSTRFTYHNPIDLLGCLKNGIGLFIECKAINGTSLPFNRFSNAQWGALYQCWKTGASVQIALNVYGQEEGRDGMRGKAYLIDFKALLSYRHANRRKRKSWNIKSLLDDSSEHVITLEKVVGRWRCPDSLII
jgi:penicillin-binding protein-related factor A (putative recombinase)